MYHKLIIFIIYSFLFRFLFHFCFLALACTIPVTSYFYNLLSHPPGPLLLNQDFSVLPYRCIIFMTGMQMTGSSCHIHKSAQLLQSPASTCCQMINPIIPVSFVWVSCLFLTSLYLCFPTFRHYFCKLPITEFTQEGSICILGSVTTM